MRRISASALYIGLLAIAGWDDPLPDWQRARPPLRSWPCDGLDHLRTKGLALLVLGMAVTLIFYELANHFPAWTGGADGLQGISVKPIFGLFEFDMYGKVGFAYAGLVLLACLLGVRHLVLSPSGDRWWVFARIRADERIAFRSSKESSSSSPSPRDRRSG